MKFEHKYYEEKGFTIRDLMRILNALPYEATKLPLFLDGMPATGFIVDSDSGMGVIAGGFVPEEKQVGEI